MYAGQVLAVSNAGRSTYIGLTQVEFSFRICKSDLAIRPIFHRTEKRAQAHIMVYFLALVM